MLLALMMSIAVQGVVVAKDGPPMPGVTVTLIQGVARTTVVTDANGKFAFPKATDSPYALYAELDGFAPAEVWASGDAPVKIALEVNAVFDSGAFT